MFGRKPKLGVDDLREIIAELSDDEKKELFSSFSGKDDDVAEEKDDKTDSGDPADESKAADDAEESAADDGAEAPNEADGSGGEEPDAVPAEEIAEEESVTEAPASDAQDAEQDMQQDNKIDQIMELVTKLEARIAALEHAGDRDSEEIGVDDDLTDALAPAMPQSYLDKAKAMRY